MGRKLDEFEPVQDEATRRLSCTIDEIRVGTEYRDVAPGIAIPESQPEMEDVVYDPEEGFFTTVHVEPGYS